MITWAASSAVVAGFQRAVIHAIPGPGRRHGLCLLELLAEVDVPAPEIDQLAGSIDFGLLHTLALAQDGRRVEAVTERATQQICRPKEHRSARLPGRSGPVVVRREGRVNRCPDVVCGRCIGLHDAERVAVWCANGEALAVSVDGAPTDVEWHGMRRSGLHLVNRGAEAGSLRRPRGIQQNWLVARWR
jgi:hypothetical protein